MSATIPLQLALWQGISRHLDISESTESTAALLAEHLPLRSLVVRRLEPEHAPRAGDRDVAREFDRQFSSGNSTSGSGLAPARPLAATAAGTA